MISIFCDDLSKYRWKIFAVVYKGVHGISLQMKFKGYHQNKTLETMRRYIEYFCVQCAVTRCQSGL